MLKKEVREQRRHGQPSKKISRQQSWWDVSDDRCRHRRRVPWCLLAVHISKVLKGGRRWAKQWHIISSDVRTRLSAVPFNWLQQQSQCSLSWQFLFSIINTLIPTTILLCRQIVWLFSDFCSAAWAVSLDIFSVFWALKYFQGRQNICTRHSMVAYLKPAPSYWSHKKQKKPTVHQSDSWDADLRYTVLLYWEQKPHYKEVQQVWAYRHNSQVNMYCDKTNNAHYF